MADMINANNEEDDLGEFTSGLTEEKVTEKLKKYNSSWDDYSNSLFPKLRDYYNMYRKMGSTVSGIPSKVALVFTTIETMLPHLLNNLFATSYIVDAKAKSNVAEETTDRVNKYVNTLIKNICDGRRKTELIIKNMCIYGYSIVKATWNLDPDKDVDANKFLPDGITPNPNFKKVINVNSAHPDFYLVDNFSFAWDPNYEEQKIDGIDWIRERIFISKNKIKQMRDAGECLAFDDNDMSSEEDKGKASRDSASKKQSGTFYDEFWCTLYDKIPVMDTRVVLDPATGMEVTDPMTGQPMTEEYDTGETKTVSDEYRIWFLANNKIIKFEKNQYGYKPYTCVRYISSPFEFTGMGVPELLGPVSAQLSMNNYQVGRMMKKIGQSVTWVDSSSGLSPKNLERIEQGVIFLKNINGVRSEQSFDPNNVKVLMDNSQMLRAEAEYVSGITKFLQGTDIGDMTATQASLISQNSTNRLANALTHLQEDFAVPLAEIFFMMNKQLLETPIDFITDNDELITMMPEDFLGNYDWSPVSPVTISNKALQLQQNTSLGMQFFQAAQASQGSPNPFWFDSLPWITQHIAPNANVTDVGSFLKPLAPPPPMNNPEMPSVPVQNGNNMTPPQGIGPMTSAPQTAGPSPLNSATPMAPAPPIK